MTLLLSIVVIFLCGLLDRLRGSDRYSIPVFGKGNSGDTLLYAFAAAYLLGLEPSFYGVFGLLFLVGEATGYGEPWGAALNQRDMHAKDLEWWQKGVLAESVTGALAARGVIWGLPTLAIAYWQPQVVLLPVAMAIAFVMAPLVATKLDDVSQWKFPPTDKGRWDKAECIRGWLVGAILSTSAFW